MSDYVRPDHIMKLLSIVPNGSLSLRASRSEGNLQVQVQSQGVVVGEKYRVAANTVGYEVVGLSVVGVTDGN